MDDTWTEYASFNLVSSLLSQTVIELDTASDASELDAYRKCAGDVIAYVDRIGLFIEFLPKAWRARLVDLSRRLKGEFSWLSMQEMVGSVDLADYTEKFQHVADLYRTELRELSRETSSWAMATKAEVDDLKLFEGMDWTDFSRLCVSRRSEAFQADLQLKSAVKGWQRKEDSNKRNPPISLTDLYSLCIGKENRGGEVFATSKSTVQDGRRQKTFRLKTTGKCTGSQSGNGYTKIRVMTLESRLTNADEFRRVPLSCPLCLYEK